MINLNKHRIDFGKGDVGIGVIGNTTDSAQLAFYNQSACPIHILKNPDQNPGFERNLLLECLRHILGSLSITSTFFPAFASPTARFTQLVVLPTPPFCEHNASTLQSFITFSSILFILP